jgi:hypothetical protein
MNQDQGREPLTIKVTLTDAPFNEGGRRAWNLEFRMPDGFYNVRVDADGNVSWPGKIRIQFE